MKSKYNPELLNAEALKALKASIKHHEAILAGHPDHELTSDDCPLCSLYFVGCVGCVGCPIYKKTGEKTCSGTPYYDIIEHLHVDHQDDETMKLQLVKGCKVCQRLEKKEIEFLKSLLPGAKKGKKKE